MLPGSGTYRNLRVEVRGRAAVATIDRPKVLNAFDLPTMEELFDVTRQVATRPELAGLVVTGAGAKAFVAGGDIGFMAEFRPEQAKAYSVRLHELLRALLYGPKVSVAAINGYALGGGLELAMSCDFRIAAEHAQLGLPEVTLGAVPGMGGTQRLARLVGEERAKELLLTGERIPAQRALEIGLVGKVVPADRVLPEALDLVERVGRNGPLAVQIAKRALQEGLDRSLPDGLALEADAFREVFGTRDQKEGMRAFLDKRKPSFEGR